MSLKCTQMRITGRKRLVKFWKKHGRAKSTLQRWELLVEEAEWTSLQDAKKTFASADGFKVKSRTVTVFNAGNNTIVTEIQYQRKWVNVRFTLTHDEYSTEKWKERL